MRKKRLGQPADARRAARSVPGQRRLAQRVVREVFWRLLAYFGPQHWWPGETPLEVCIGAILTQNTNWANVEKAIANLKRRCPLKVPRLLSMPCRELEALLRPAGYYHVKARRLRAFLEYLTGRYGGSLARMRRWPTERLRAELLGVHGIGRETADSMLLYAFSRPVFVIDAYTRRFVGRHGLADAEADYDELRSFFESALKPLGRRRPRSKRTDGGAGKKRRSVRAAGGGGLVEVFNEMHALLVRLGKEYCGRRPRCESCPLADVPRAPAAPGER